MWAEVLVVVIVIVVIFMLMKKENVVSGYPRMQCPGSTSYMPGFGCVQEYSPHFVRSV